jgi:large subunit ribosomal protein L28
MPPQPPSLTLLRFFSSTRVHHGAIPTKEIPTYPYGPATWYKQSNKGLYGHSRVRFGNNVSSKTETKTRRTWHPNIHRKRLWSYALGRWVRVKVQARVLRTIDKVGGLDEYLLGDKVNRIKELGVAGWALRWRIMQTNMVRERFRRERLAMGLPPEEPWVGEMVESGGGSGGEEVVMVKAHERAIDEILDRDEAAEKRGEDGGIELGVSREMEEGTLREGEGQGEEKWKEVVKKTRW